MSKRTTGRLSAVLLAVLAVVASSATTATAEQSSARSEVGELAPAARSAQEAGHSPEEVAAIQRTAAEAEIASELSAILAGEPGYISSGYLGSNRVGVWARSSDWSSETARAVNQKTDEASQEGISVEIIDVLYGEMEILELLESVADEATARFGYTFTKIGGKIDTAVFAGPEVSVDPVAQDNVRALVDEMLDAPIPTEFVAEPDFQSRMPLDTRLSYSRPYRGGAFISSSNSLGCTAGLPMEKEDDSAHYLLTAAHCSQGYNGINVYRADGAQIGKSQSIQNLFGTRNSSKTGGPRLDAALIKLNGTFDSNGTPFASNRIFVGASSSSTLTYTISGNDTIPYSTPLCISGSREGRSCNLIRPSGTTTSKEFVPCMFLTGSTCMDGYSMSTVLVKQYGTNVAGDGDSGAPIYSYLANNKVEVYATLSFGDDQAPCLSLSTYCFNSAYVAPLSLVMDVIGPSDVQVRTG